MRQLREVGTHTALCRQQAMLALPPSLPVLTGSPNVLFHKREREELFKVKVRRPLPSASVSPSVRVGRSQVGGPGLGEEGGGGGQRTYRPLCVSQERAASNGENGRRDGRGGELRQCLRVYTMLSGKDNYKAHALDKIIFPF